MNHFMMENTNMETWWYFDVTAWEFNLVKSILVEITIEMGQWVIKLLMH